MGRPSIGRFAATAAIAVAIFSLSGLGRRPPADETGTLGEETKIIINPASAYLQISGEANASHDKVSSSIPNEATMVEFCKLLQQQGSIQELFRTSRDGWHAHLIAQTEQGQRTEGAETGLERQEWTNNFYDELLMNDIVECGGMRDLLQEMTGLRGWQPPERLQAYEDIAFRVMIVALSKWGSGEHGFWHMLLVENIDPATNTAFKRHLTSAVEEYWNDLQTLYQEDELFMANCNKATEAHIKEEIEKAAASPKYEKWQSEIREQKREIERTVAPKNRKQQYIELLAKLEREDRIEILAALERAIPSSAEATQEHRRQAQLQQELVQMVPVRSSTQFQMTESLGDDLGAKHLAPQERRFRVTREQDAIGHHRQVHAARAEHQSRQVAEQQRGHRLLQNLLHERHQRKEIEDGVWHTAAFGGTDLSAPITGALNSWSTARYKKVWVYMYDHKPTGRGRRVTWEPASWEDVKLRTREVATEVVEAEEQTDSQPDIGGVEFGPFADVLVLTPPEGGNQHSIWSLFDFHGDTCGENDPRYEALVKMLSIITSFSENGGYVALTLGTNEPWNAQEAKAPWKWDLASTGGSFENARGTKAPDVEIKTLWAILQDIAPTVKFMQTITEICERKGLNLDAIQSLRLVAPKSRPNAMCGALGLGRERWDAMLFRNEKTMRE